MASLEEIKLPVLTPDENWLDRIDADLELSKKIKRLFYLPMIAYKTAVYKNENELTHFQKDRLILLFRNEAEQAFNVVHNQVLLIVGNAPADRIEYLKAFESWKERLVALLEISINCITKGQWIKEFTSSFPSKEQLAVEGKLTTEGKLTVEGKKQFEEIFERHYKKLKESVFDERIYFNKFSKFITEAIHLLRRFSVMHSITMERTEWWIRGLENIGKLPENVKTIIKENGFAKRQNNLQTQVEKIVSECLDKPIEELNTLLKNISEQKMEINIGKIEQFTGMMGSVQQPENLQVGNNTSIHKHPKAKTVGIVGSIAAFLAILNYLGWLEPIKAFVCKILWPK